LARKDWPRFVFSEPGLSRMNRKKPRPLPPEPTPTILRHVLEVPWRTWCNFAYTVYKIWLAYPQRP
jgi:hypothetical protein